MLTVMFDRILAVIRKSRLVARILAGVSALLCVLIDGSVAKLEVGGIDAPLRVEQADLKCRYRGCQ